MASNIGSMVVLLGANYANLQSDLGKAAMLNARYAEEMAKKWNDAGAQIGRAMGLAVAAGATALVALTKSAIDSADEISKLSQKVGIGTEALSALKYQAGLAGVELAGLQTGIVKFSRSIAEAAGGSKEQAETFKAMGISLRTLDGALKPTERLLEETAEAFSSYEDGAAKTALAVRVFGKAGAEMIPLLNEGAEGMARAAKEAEEYGIIVGSEAAKAAEQVNDNLDRLKTAAQGFGNQLAQQLLPTLVAFSDEMAEGAKEGAAFADAAKTIADAMRMVGQVFVVVKQVVEGFVNLIAAAVDTLIGFAEIGAGVMTNLGHATMGTLRAASGDFSGAMADFKLAGDALSNGWEAGAARVKTAWTAATEGIDYANERSLALFNALSGNMAKVTDEAERVKIAIANIQGYTQLPTMTVRPTRQAPIFDRSGGTDKAAADAKKLAEEIKRLNEAVEDGALKMSDLADSFVKYLDPMDEETARFAEDMRDISRAAVEQAENIEELREKTGDANAAASQHAELQREVVEAIANATAAHEANVVTIQRAKGVTELFVAELMDETRLLAMTSTQQKTQAVVLRALAEAKKQNVTIDEQRIRQLSQLQQAMTAAANINTKSPLFEMADQAKEMGEAIKTAIEEGMDPELIKPMEDALKKLNSQLKVDSIGGFKALLGAAQTFTKEGSSGFKTLEKGMAALSIVQDILALKAAVTAVLSQGQAPPPMSFAAMAAMAAAVAPLLASIGMTMSAFSGGSGGGGSNGADARQLSQGTGSILGDTEAKSESMVNAMEITADATSALVGINRGMLNALQAMQAGISGASAGIARVEFGDLSLSEGMGMNSMLNPFGASGTIGGRLVTAIFGGDQDLIDQGIRIVGGTLNDMIDNIMASAYQTVETNGGWFGSDDIDDEFQALSDRTTTQLRLVLQSISDAVSEGAEALGISGEEISAAIAAFRIEEIRISTMDLTGEEAQAELEAVFSMIFDDLAGSVVPFIEQFQQVGEGLGETLVRVATGVQVTQEAMRYLGIAIDEADPERFAQISEGLIAAVGGIDAMIEGMQSFVASFASDAHRLEVATSELNDAFAEAGLTVPNTRDAMWDLMQTFDATTAEGQEQIATLLRLAGVASQYYDLLEKAEKARLDYTLKAAEIRAELGTDGGGFVAARAQIEAWTTDTIHALNDLARAAGRAGAAEQDLVNVHSVAAQRVAQLIKQLKQQASDLAVQLGYITQGDTLESLNAQIASLGSASVDAGAAIGDAVDGMREKMNLLLGDLSPFNDQRKLELALQGLREGSVDPQQVLEIGRRLYASTSNYTALFEQVMGMARFGNPGSSGADTAGSETGDGRTLAQLIEARDAMLEAQRPQLADELARRIAELSYATGDDFAELAEGMGFDLARIADDLSVSDEALQALLETYRDQFESQDWSELGTTLTNAIDLSRDAIVAAIEGRPVDDIINAADQRMADQEALRAEGQTRLADLLEGTNARLDSLTSTIVSSDRQSDAVISGALNENTMEAREGRLLASVSGLQTLRSVGSVLSR